MDIKDIKESRELAQKSKSIVSVIVIISFILLIVSVLSMLYFGNQTISELRKPAYTEPTEYQKVKAEVIATNNMIFKDGDGPWYTTLTIVQGNYRENVTAYFKY